MGVGLYSPYSELPEAPALPRSSGISNTEHGPRIQGHSAHVRQIAWSPGWAPIGWGEVCRRGRQAGER